MVVLLLQALHILVCLCELHAFLPVFISIFVFACAECGTHSDGQWVECTSCMEWLHFQCVGIVQEGCLNSVDWTGLDWTGLVYWNGT